MERGVDGKFKSSAPPDALTSGEDASGAGETRYEKPAESLTTPVAAASMPAFPSGAGHKNAEDSPIKNDESAEVQTRGAGEGGGGTNDEAEKNVYMLAAVKRQMNKGREGHEDRLDAKQRQIDDFQRRQTDEDREGRLRQRENTARRQEATERDIEEKRVRLRIGGMRLNRTIATLGRNIPLHKLKLQTLSGDPAEVYDQITSSSMGSQFIPMENCGGSRRRRLRTKRCLNSTASSPVIFALSATADQRSERLFLLRNR
jgi:hypothetical protein